MQQQRMLVAKALTKSRSQSQGVVSKNKHQDLRYSGTSQLDDDDLVENENHAADFNIKLLQSSFHGQKRLWLICLKS